MRLFWMFTIPQCPDNVLNIYIFDLLSVSIVNQVFFLWGDLSLFKAGSEVIDNIITKFRHEIFTNLFEYSAVKL